MGERLSKTWIFVFKLILGAAILGIIILKLDFSKLEGVDFSWIFLLFAMLNLAVLQTFRALRWKLILSGYYKYNRSLSELIKIVFIGRFFTLFTPGQIGDLMRAKYIEMGTIKSSSSVVLDKIFDIFVLFVLFCVSGFLLRSTLMSFLNLQYFIIALIILTAGIIAAYVFYTMNKRRIKKIFFYEKVNFLSITTVWIFAASLMIWLSMILQMYFMARLISVVPESIIGFSLATIITIFATFLPITISGIGLREGAAYYLYPLIGINASLAALFSFAGFLSTVLVSAIIGYVFFLTQKSK